ncbi:MAG: hypothetical protein MRY21_05010 [Simkaniaceae bacterium]|nr:hypothetical protein [Simkaniaceae bacterium]
MPKTLASCLVATSLLLSSCGYRVQSSGVATVDVPFLKKDTDGRLTTSLISILNRSGVFTYASHDARYLLEGELTTLCTEVIGYQYRRKDGSTKILHRIVDNEGRRNVSAVVSLIDLETGEKIFGPTKISASSDFDYVDPDNFFDLTFDPPNGPEDSVLNFSLGQLDSQEGASLASIDPAFQNLAAKITQALSAAIAAKQ